MEQRGVIVQRTLLGGMRAIALPHLDCQTAAGDPHAPDPADMMVAVENGPDLFGTAQTGT
jgi:hypothetical protein